MTRKSRNLLTLLLILGCSGATADPVKAKESLPKDWRGGWQERGAPEGSSVYLSLEPDRIVEHDGTSLVVRGVIHRDGNLLFLRNQGIKEKWVVAQTGSVLRIADEEGTVRSFERLSQIPPQVRLEPLALPHAHPLPPEKIRVIQTEIEARFQREQEILQNPARQGEFGAVRQENLAFLRQVVNEVGWIDAERFGSQTSMQAIFLAKHSNDLPLLQAILPYAEKEFKRPGRGQTYAILYDEVQLDLGHKQRYGTQVFEDEHGPFVLPLEDPENVDQYLKEVGLPPLRDYLNKVGEVLYPGRRVEIRPEEAITTASLR